MRLPFKIPPLPHMLTWLTLSAGMGVLLFSYLHYSETGTFPNETSTQWLTLSLIAGVLAGVVLYVVNQLLNKLISYKTHFVWRFFFGTIINVIAAGICLLAVVFLFIESAKPWQNFSPDDADLVGKVVLLLVLTLFIYNVIYALLYSYKQYAVTQVESLQQERKQLELQFEALKNQISPHYLFNSLNTISSLIHRDPESAEQFIRRLAQTYRYILHTQDKKFVLLSEEIEFVQSYYYLLRIRFQQQLALEFNIPNNILKSRIPPLTLQMLVENAVKHNQPASDKQLFIYITAQDNLRLKVINTKNDTALVPQSFHIGMENIKKRYAYFTDQRIEIRDEDRFIVSLPVIHGKEGKVMHKFSA